MAATSPPPADVLTADVVIVLESPRLPIAAYREAFAVLSLRQVAGAVTLQGPDGAILATAPQAALAIIVPPGAGKQGDITAWAGRQLLECPVIAHAEGLAAALLGLAAQRRRSARRVTDLLLELAALRMAHSDLQASHDALRTLLREQGLLLPRLALFYPPDPAGRALPAAASDVVQPVAVDIRTLCGVSVHAAAPLPSGLILELQAPDQDAVVARWEIAAGTPAGWISFAFAAQAGLPAGPAALRLRWAGNAPRLSLGRPTSRPDLAASIDGVPGDRPLALRAFAGPPGAPLLVTDSMAPAWPREGAKLTRIDLALADLRPLDLRRLHERFHFRPVEVMAAERQIQVHPVELLPTIACLRGICPPGTRAVGARVATVNPAAGPIDYALHVPETAAGDIPPDADWLEALAGALIWTTIAADEETLLRLNLPAPLAAAADLLLLTRLPPGASADAGWARFIAIQLHGDFDAG